MIESHCLLGLLGLLSLFSLLLAPVHSWRLPAAVIGSHPPRSAWSVRYAATARKIVQMRHAHACC